MRRSAHYDPQSLPGKPKETEKTKLCTDDSQPPSSKTRVLIALLDVDGCLYPNYFSNFDPSYLESINGNLLVFLRTQFSEKQYQRIIFGLGANRQDFELDSDNARKNDTCSCVFLLPFFQKYFQKDNSNSVLIDPLMMGDIFSCHNKDSANHSVEPGSTYAITLLKGKAPQQRDFFKSKFDQHKISLIYTHAHRAACLNPNSNITIDFFDDQVDILHALHQFFNQHPDLLPNNVELRLYQYECKQAVSPYLNPINGSGLLDQKYDRTVQFISYVVSNKRCPNVLQDSKELIYTHFLKYLEKGCALYVGEDDDYFEEPRNDMHTHALFRNIGKKIFLLMRDHIGSQLNSGLITSGYPDHLALLEMYNKMGRCNLPLTEFEKVLNPEPPSHYDNGEDEAKNQFSLKHSDGDFSPRNEEAPTTPTNAVHQPVTEEPAITPRNTGASRDKTEASNGDNNDDGNKGSQLSISGRKKKGSGFFSSLFGEGCCCGEDSCCVRKEQISGKPF